MKRKEGIVLDFTGWLILAVVFIVLMVLIIFTIKGDLFGIGDFVKNLLRFGR